ncbi:Dyp-type peroxidase [Streptacidiphilus sp. PB12-B1b]|uniref:Dyp-type peroxidase n=1 Tax=Streptacidiphilus sp. PB12-B1b TaxID=2705012 RepID=UPI0015FB7ADC|nr:Dyp-type peroxidase [Streptacidiphilus sp. PB12-B1b]QMU80243.1 Dyp-type peroxidase [Streptacidiphilus sp. PB12-B1b]
MAQPTCPAGPQAVVSGLTSAAVILVLTIDPGGEQTVRELLADLSGLERSVGFRLPDGGLSCVAGIGSNAWDRLFDGPRPAGLHPFRTFAGERHRAPSTPGDLALHIRGPRMGACFELGAQITARLDGAARVVDETHGFRSFDMRDLLGFVDGTENPAGRAAVEAVVVGDEDARFCGGAYLVVQKYLHDLAAWNALPVSEQERVIGRTKADNIELSDEAKPADSHVALNTVTGPDGGQLQILRENMPFGTLGRGEFGTYFISYSRTPEVTERMLENMFVGNPPGVYDRILDFSTAVTGGLFFAPSADFLDDLPDPPAPAAASAADRTAPPGTAPSDTAPPPDSAPDDRPPPGDGSLAIGSLRRSTQP